MDNGTLALLIPILVMCIPLLAIWTRHKRRLAEMAMMAGAGQNASAATQSASRIQALEERVAVLERIVTDADGLKGAHLAREIEALRRPEALAAAEPRPAPNPAAQLTS